MSEGSDPLEVVLVSLRDADDPMALHERLCFEEATGLPDLRVVHACEQRLGARELDADLLLFGGSGAYSVLDPEHWVRALLDFLLRVVDAGVPAYGSCFGFQGLALAMGGEVVRRADHTRMGGFPVRKTAAADADPLFGPLPARFEVQFGHKDWVTRLPAGVTLLVTDDAGHNEAFRVDGSNFWGSQFHPELTRHRTLDRFRHYQHLYDGGRGDEIVRQITGSVDHPEVPRVLGRLVELARARRRARG
ncbi:MAG: type 1 glutamine amidotransferase [Deltaproteobacteria bacterium]|nr:MAG: type 1 glutamine amidotransferase [Deltaproteobacteria bacterium]